MSTRPKAIAPAGLALCVYLSQSLITGNAVITEATAAITDEERVPVAREVALGQRFGFV